MGRFDDEYVHPKRIGDCSAAQWAIEEGLNVSAAQLAVDHVPEAHVPEALAVAGIDMPLGRIMVGQVADCRNCSATNPNKQCDYRSLVDDIEPFVNELPIDLRPAS